MNTEGLKPIDARVMKPGDRVVHDDGRKGKFIAYVPDADEAYRAWVLFGEGTIPVPYTIDGRGLSSLPVSVFLPPDPDTIDPSPGNVDKLRRSQVGEGWRIPAHDEKPDRRAQIWCDNTRWCDRIAEPVDYYNGSCTYRVPIAPPQTQPLCMADFIGKPWPLVRVRGGQATRTINAIEEFGLSISNRRDPITWDDFREQCEISWDHGKTWVRAEKAVES